MKRKYRIGIAVIMMLLMVITSSGLAFAASGSQGETPAQAVSSESQGLPDAQKGSSSLMSDEEIQDIVNAKEDQATKGPATRSLNHSMPVHRILNYSDVTLTPDVTLTATTSRSGKYVAETDWIQLKKGTFYLSGYGDENYVTLAVIDENNTVIGSADYTSANSKYTYYFDIPRTGNYYVLAICDTSNTWVKLRATLAVDLQGLYLGNNKYYVVGHSDQAQTRTYKFYPKATGYMRIYADAKCKVTLCNASGKVIAKQVTVNYRPVFGVRADRTYLIKVAWPSGSAMNRIKVVNGSWWPANGVSKAKATPMSRGKLQKGLVVAGENNIRWFKYTNWQSTLKITLTGGTNDQLVWYIYEGGTQKSRRIFTPSLANMSTTIYGAKKGVTYYVKVQKLTSTSSGYYHVKFE